MMSEQLEDIISSTENTSLIQDVKNNPVANFLLIPLKSFPLTGAINDAIDSCLKERKERLNSILCEEILKCDYLVVPNEINRIDSLVAFRQTYQAIQQTTVNEKIRLFIRLYFNSYLTPDSNYNFDLFAEYLESMKTISYRQIEFLIKMNDYINEFAELIIMKQENWKSKFKYINRKLQNDYGDETGSFYNILQGKGMIQICYGYNCSVTSINLTPYFANFAKVFLDKYSEAGGTNEQS